MDFDYGILRNIAATVGIFIVFVIVLLIAWIVFYIIGKWKLFQKAGKQGWESIIPFYSSWVLVEISGLAWWWFLIVIVPTILGIVDENLSGLAALITLFGHFCCYYNISKKLHKNTEFAILTTIFSGIMIPIIGLSKNYQFDHSIEVSDIGPFAKATTNTNTNNTTNTDADVEKKKKFCPNCGKPVEETHEFCKNCGTKLK